MAQNNSNSTMEMGTSDQVLVATKRRKRLTYVIGGAIMLAIIALVVTLSVTLTGGEGPVADSIISTTEGPTSPSGTPSAPTDPTTTTTIAPPTTTTTETTTELTTEPTTVPTTEPPPPTLDLDGIIEGAYAPPSFNATWTSGNEVLFRNTNSELVLYNVDTDDTTVVLRNTSELLQRSSRVATLSSGGEHIVLAYDVLPVYRYSFLARYSVLDTSGENENAVNIVPKDIPPEQGFLQNFVWGPVGTSLAFVFLNNIYYQDSLTDEPKKITENGVLNVVYNGIPDWVYEEEIFNSNNAIWFSKDGKKMAYATFNDDLVRIMKVPHYGVPAISHPQSSNYQYTQHHEIRYPKSGTTNPTVTVTLHDLATNLNDVYTGPADLEQPILKTVVFVNNNEIALMWTNRVQTTLKVVLCTAGNSNCRQIYEYTESNGWIDNIPLIFNEAGNSFITILPQTVNTNLYKQIVQVSQNSGEAGAVPWTASNRINTAHTVIEIIQWTSSDDIWYKATSVSDSAEQHIYSVNPSNEVKCFTCDIKKENGKECLYNEGAISTGGSRIVVNCAGPDIPQVFIYNTDGTRISVWDDSNELSETLEGLVVPETFRESIVIEGAADADVMIQVPPGYANSTGLPLLVYVYGGPDTALVTKQWSLDWGSYLVSRLGMAVAHIDGRGSGLRGVENMFAIDRKLGTLEIQDQIHVTRQLQQHTWIDANRTCIWGWSYGGYAATKALAEGGDVFRCAAAVAPVVDWRFYDTIYTERYMDLPSVNADGYEVSSLLTDNVVNALRNKSYFLIHGTADDNVHYQHAMLLSRILQRNDVYFTQMSYTDEDHGLIGVRPHLYHALEKFLREHML